MPNVLAVVSASGGLGASCLVAAFAVRAADAGRSACVVDLDRASGRLDVVLGVEQEPGWRWPHLAGVRGVVDGAGLAAELPVARGVAVLSGAAGWSTPESGAAGVGDTAGDAPGDRAAAVVGGGSWRDDADGGRGAWLDVVPEVVAGLGLGHEVTVLDVPLDPALLAAVAPLLDACVVLVGTDVVQLAAAALAVPAVRRLVDDGRRAADDWSGPAPTRLEPWVVLRGEQVEPDLEDVVMDELGLPVVAVLGDDRRLAADLAHGRPPGARGRGALVRTADELLLRLVARAVAA